MSEALPTRDRMERFLTEEWRRLRDDCSVPALSSFRLQVHSFEMLGLLSVDQARAWRKAAESCPGHDDEGGRAWCAYCGHLPRGDGA